MQNDPPAREKATFEEKRREDMLLKVQSYCVLLLLRSQQSTTNGEIIQNTSRHKTFFLLRGRKEYTEHGNHQKPSEKFKRV